MTALGTELGQGALSRTTTATGEPGPSARGRQASRAWLLMLPFLVLYVVFIVVPAVSIVLKSFASQSTQGIEILNPANWGGIHFTLDNYGELLGDDYIRGMIGNTVLIAAIAVVATTVVGTLIAYELGRGKGRFAAAVRWIISLPVYLPSIVIAFSLLLFLGPNGLLNAAVRPIFGTGIDLIYSSTAVTLGTMVVLLPIHIRVVAAAIENIPANLIEASASLGAGELRTLVSVVIPMARASILAALILNFAFAVGMVEIALIVGGGGLKVPYLPVEILQRTTSFNPDVSETSAMSTILIVIALLGQAISMIIIKRSSRGGVSQ
ncbi:MAG TPA: ABC transporter permease subunit [Pseudolysinimonas sp.]|jgi:ABC-type spermidine/putrescine transport system permease subunit II